MANLSLILYYIDIQTAFATMARALAFPAGEESDDTFAARLMSLGFNPSDLSNFLGALSSPSRFKDTYGSLHMALVLRSLANTSWLSSSYLPRVIVPTSGSMAGTSIADLLFLAAFANLLERFDSECDRFGLTHTLDSS